MEFSLKGIVVGAVVGTLFALIAGFLMGFFLGFLYGANETVQMMTPGSNTFALFPILMLSLIVYVVSGYVAAWSAGKGELLNSGIGSFLVALIGVATGPADLMTISIALLVLGPLFGMFGGYIRRQQQLQAA